MMETFCSPFPFDEPRRISIFEIEAPDYSTQFLGFPCHMSEDEQFFITHLIEAPVDCPIRRKFEFGEITWQEFWFHWGWLIEHQHEVLSEGGAYVCYVHPSQMMEHNGFYFERYNHLSPMVLKLQELERRSTVDYYVGDNMAELAVKLIEFRKTYPEIVNPDAAKPKAA